MDTQHEMKSFRGSSDNTELESLSDWDWDCSGLPILEADDPFVSRSLTETNRRLSLIVQQLAAYMEQFRPNYSPDLSSCSPNLSIKTDDDSTYFPDDYQCLSPMPSPGVQHQFSSGSGPLKCEVIDHGFVSDGPIRSVKRGRPMKALSVGASSQAKYAKKYREDRKNELSYYKNLSEQLMEEVKMLRQKDRQRDEQERVVRQEMEGLRQALQRTSQLEGIVQQLKSLVGNSGNKQQLVETKPSSPNDFQLPGSSSPTEELFSCFGNSEDRSPFDLIPFEETVDIRELDDFLFKND